ncbi:helix-turn-helix domain-containing protein [Thalassovita mediterranea]|jgi:transcriptional regulator with XRE-family HTH domain|uniref:Putative transcriptional regulator n=1 Tax=Thalassovita mediterranea TaxID=340021 RepID=A0A0P1GLD9_9RHOB|nr:helix-turn-helix transcriptional regulator [Thalassovita mediterranea]MCG7573546.1 helix-turn-helix domain-containing protein [Phaeobacter sp. CNT1-3]CUH82910.1 putative transcriptional regulator [Thalassovita mediterranea]SIS31422.1 Transcriptional regulator, contains XRE-family HTH domain [Thalassovita mediterranea]
MSHPVDIHVGKKLKNLRVLRGQTQTDVAKGLNISFQQVQKYELGRNRISASKLYEIANILNVPPAYFFEGLDQTADAAGPVIDEETARIAAVFGKIQDDRLKAQIRSFIDAVAGYVPAENATNS